MSERPTGPPFIQHEMAVRPVEDGWRTFVVMVDEHGPQLWPNAWDLPVLPTKVHALELGCLILWEYLDLQEHLVVPEKGTGRPHFEAIDILD